MNILDEDETIEAQKQFVALIMEDQKQFRALIKDIVQNDICEQVKHTIMLLSDKARNNPKIKEYLTEKIEIVEKERILSAREENATKIYRAMYLDGDTRPTARQIGDKFAYDKRMVFRKRDCAISSLAVVIAGLYGIEWQSMLYNDENNEPQLTMPQDAESSDGAQQNF